MPVLQYSFILNLSLKLRGGGGCSIGIKNETLKAQFQADTIFSDPNVCLIELLTLIFSVGLFKTSQTIP